MFKQRVWVCVCALLLAATGCLDTGSAESDAEEGAGASHSQPGTSVCTQASAYLDSCASVPLSLGPHCEPTLAESILATPCEALGKPNKADVFADAFCSSGLLYWCPDPVCHSAPKASQLDDYSGRCEELLQRDDCASCAYYDCVARERGEQSCGYDGYLESFAGPYCRRFSLLSLPRLSEEGQRWIEDVRSCLQEAVADAVSQGPSLSCSALKQEGFDSHPGCYVETGFCSLPFADKWQVFTTVDPRHLGLQPIKTAMKCIGF